MLSGLRIQRCRELCGVGRRWGLDLALLWLWHRLAAVTLIRPIAWEPLYAVGAALKKAKKEKKPQLLQFFNVANSKQGTQNVFVESSNICKHVDLVLIFLLIFGKITCASIHIAGRMFPRL